MANPIPLRHLFLLLILSAAVTQVAAAITPFSASLEALEDQIGYKFKASGLLRRAMTHSSYSRDNFRALSILGLDAVRAADSLRLVQADIDVSPESLSKRLAADTDGDACAEDGLRLGLEKVVRVSAGTNASTPSVVCGAFRAIFGAVAVDSGTIDAAGEVFRRVHGDRADGAALSDT